MMRKAFWGDYKIICAEHCIVHKLSLPKIKSSLFNDKILKYAMRRGSVADGSSVHVKLDQLASVSFWIKISVESKPSYWDDVLL